MHLNNGLDIPPRNPDILETSILEILRTYNASMWLAGPNAGEGNYKDTLVTTPLALVNDPIGYVEDVSSSTQSENLWCNSTWTGAPAPATPTNLVRTASPTNGITTAIIAKGTDEFGSYIDIEWTGTCVTGTVYAQLYSNPTVACNPGDVISLRTRHQIISGTVPPNLVVTVHARDAADVFLAPAAASYPSLALKEEDSSSIVPALTAKVYCTILNTINVGVTVNCVLRVWYVQVNKGRAQPHLPTTGTLIQRADTFIPLIQTTTGFKPSLAGGVTNHVRKGQDTTDNTYWFTSGGLTKEEFRIVKDLGTVVKLRNIDTVAQHSIRIYNTTTVFPDSIKVEMVMHVRYISGDPVIGFQFKNNAGTFGSILTFNAMTGVIITGSAAGISLRVEKAGEFWKCVFVADSSGAGAGVANLICYFNAGASVLGSTDDVIEVGGSMMLTGALPYNGPFIPSGASGLTYASTPPYSWKFDGVDDRLAMIRPAIPNSGNRFRIAAFKMPATAPASTNVIASGTGAGGQRNAQIFISSGSFNVVGTFIDDAAVNSTLSFTGRVANERVVVSAQRQAAGVDLRCRSDLLASAALTGATVIGTTTTLYERIGCHAPAGVDQSFCSLEIYGVITGSGQPSLAEMGALENFLAGHAGFTPLP